jgi:hypothetical protein
MLKGDINDILDAVKFSSGEDVVVWLGVLEAEPDALG